MHTARGRAPHRGFTLVELLVVVAVLAVLAAILLSVIASARAKARETDCRTKLHQIGLALRLYADDYNGRLPPSWTWDLALSRYLSTRPPYSCPDVKYWEYNPRVPWTPGELMRGYAYNAFLAGVPPTLAQASQPERPFRIGEVKFPATTVAFNEANVRVVTSTIPDYPATYGVQAEAGGVRHRGGSNYTFLDGHVKWYRPEQVRGIVPSRFSEAPMRRRRTARNQPFVRIDAYPHAHATDRTLHDAVAIVTPTTHECSVRTVPIRLWRGSLHSSGRLSPTS